MNQTKVNNFFFGLANTRKKEGEQGEQKYKKEYVMFFDGSSKGNPGISGAGACICENEEEIWFQTMFVGDHETNNVAEYSGLILGLQEAVRRNIKEITVKGDSELVIKQMRGEYKVKSSHLRELYNKALKLSQTFDKITFIHIFREFNTRADLLSNQAFDDL